MLKCWSFLSNSIGWVESFLKISFLLIVVPNMHFDTFRASKRSNALESSHEILKMYHFCLNTSRLSPSRILFEKFEVGEFLVAGQKWLNCHGLGCWANFRGIKRPWCLSLFEKFMNIILFPHFDFHKMTSTDRNLEQFSAKVSFLIKVARV